MGDVSRSPAAPATTVDDVLRDGTVNSVFQPDMRMYATR